MYDIDSASYLLYSILKTLVRYFRVKFASMFLIKYLRKEITFITCFLFKYTFLFLIEEIII